MQPLVLRLRFLFCQVWNQNIGKKCSDIIKMSILNAQDSCNFEAIANQSISTQFQICDSMRILIKFQTDWTSIQASQSFSKNENYNNPSVIVPIGWRKLVIMKFQKLQVPNSSFKTLIKYLKFQTIPSKL